MRLPPKIAIALLLAGCDAPSQDPLASTSQPLLGGAVSDPSEDAVVKVEATQSTVIQTCSGALVAPNLVLTARHCVADYVDLAFTCNAEGDLTSGPGGYTGAVVAPDKIAIKVGVQPPNRVVSARGAQVFSLPSTTVCRNDIALVLLDRAVPDVTPLPIRLDRGTAVGEVMRAIGYGISDDADAGLSTRHSRPGFVITKVGTSQYHPNGDNIPPRSFQVDGGGLCIGDSGGPAIGESGAIIGIDSKFTGPCTSSFTLTFYTETGPFSDELIRPAFAAAGYEPIVEVPPTGAAGAGGATTTAPNAGAGNGGASSTSDGGSAPYTGGNVGQGGNTASTSSSDAAGGEDVIYEGAPPKGGGCACRQGRDSHRGFFWFAGLVGALCLLRRTIPTPEAVRVRAYARRHPR